MLDLEYNSDSGNDTANITKPTVSTEASSLESVIKPEDTIASQTNTAEIENSVKPEMDPAKAEDASEANAIKLKNVDESQVDPTKPEAHITNEAATPQTAAALKDPKVQPVPDAKTSDNDAPEETTSTKPVRALEKKRKRNKNKGSKNADAQHPSKRQKGSASQKEPVAAGQYGAADGESAGSAVPEGFCVVCCAAKGKYKCPRCRAQICSVPCSKSHQANHPADPPPAAPAAPPTNVFVAPSQPSSDPSHPFSFLDDSPKIRALFTRYPCLADALMKISDAMQPPTVGAAASAAAAMPFVQSEAKRLEKRLWDKAQGEKHGKAALRRVRALDTVEGEAVRAYCELVLHLMQTQGKGVREVRKRKAREEGAMFQKLAKAEAKKEGL